ncbi:MAG: cell division protein ZapE [Rhodospirillales bacterium]|jgi:cell division protein ZapE|nr:cell division protein ZapE [Rhodospirillales bacterium]
MFVTTQPIDAYNALINKGTIQPDPAQQIAMDRLQSLHEELEGYSLQMGQTGWRSRLNLRGRKKERPKGLYLWGDVGRGKSMLMELFYTNSNVDERKHIHFHAFMQEVHRRVHSYREAQKAGQVSAQKDPLQGLARIIVDQAWLLCFDEFHVTDITDAMILGRLFESLINEGVVIVATSNRPPHDLYKDGLQRELFLPFIDLIEDKMDVLELTSPTDYRLERIRAMDTFITPNGAEANAKLEKCFQELSIGAEPEPINLFVQGREIEFPKTAEGVAMTNFTTLCDQPLGPADYLAIAARFHTVILMDIPRMGPENRDVAKRFLTLVETLYEAKVNFICSAEAPAEKLYPEGDGSFEFERTVSRLMEMQSPDYIALPHMAS